MTDLASGFQNVDSTEESRKFTDFLEFIDSIAFFQSYKREGWQFLNLQPGESVLELGCGVGKDALRMARAVGKSGRVVAIDRSRAMLDIAEKSAVEAGLDIEFVLADVTSLPFADNTFDAARIDRTLMHVPEPRQAIAEMMRVTRSGGKFVAFEPDWETLTVNSENRSVTRRILTLWCDTFPSGWVARSLTKYFKYGGAIDVVAEPRTLKTTDLATAERLFEFSLTADKAVEGSIVTDGEAGQWLAELAEIDRSGAFLSTVTGFLVTGKKG